ncbi:MAG: hypothetical protein ACYDHY_13100 [Acidiferrobacterales bacterium]
MKIVINNSYGEFSLSWEAVRFMAQRGHAVAQKEFQKYESHPDKRPFEFGSNGGVKGFDRGQLPAT